MYMDKVSRIFVVDDEELIRELLHDELSDEGYRVTLFADGGTALGALEHDNPDLMILDIRMPGIDGLQVLKESKQHHPDLPVVLCSAYSDYKHDFGAWSADGYFVKADHLDGLKAMVHQLLHSDSASPTSSVTH